MGTGGIPTTGNIPETTQIFGCPTDNIPDNHITILHFKNERVINRSSELFHALCLHTTPQILKNLSIFKG